MSATEGNPLQGAPLRVAIIGAGPAGFYTLSNLFRQKELAVEIDMFDRLPTPFGLVRAGVAPDHQKDKSVQKVYDKNAQEPNVRFYGNVEYGSDLSLDDLKQHYHQIVFTNGASLDRNLGILGEDLQGSFSATEFVAWYNGHPDYAGMEFDLSQENVAIVGIGNVAMDLARILCKTHAELAATDIADYALEALRHSKVKKVYVLGRRGPAQAAFTPPEITEMGEFSDAEVRVLPEEATLDAASQVYVTQSNDKNVQKNVALVQGYATRKKMRKARQLYIRFLVSPTELIGEDGRVVAIRLEKNELVEGADGVIRPRSTGKEEILPVGLVFRSVGYKGRPLPDIPSNAKQGTIHNEAGRVMTEEGAVSTGLYTAGWSKRGPTGVIGTNKTCARETVACMLEDLAAGLMLAPVDPSIEGTRALIAKRQPEAVSYEEWMKIDQEEVSRGTAQHRPRVKITNRDELLRLAKG